MNQAARVFAGVPQRKDMPVHTNTYEIADRIFRLSTCVAEAAPGGFTFNQFLLMHGSSTRTRCGESLLRLADAYDSMIKQD